MDEMLNGTFFGFCFLKKSINLLNRSQRFDFVHQLMQMTQNWMKKKNVKIHEYCGFLSFLFFEKKKKKNFFVYD